jgi:hypothetical protein
VVANNGVPALEVGICGEVGAECGVGGVSGVGGVRRGLIKVDNKGGQCSQQRGQQQ